MRNKKALSYFWLAMVLLMVSIFIPTTVSAAEKTYTIVLDPGHGGSDSGATATYSGKTYKESDIAWWIAVYTKRYLEAHDSSIKVHVTRSGDEYVSLADRVNQAVVRNADLLVSQHINSSSSESAKGASVLISRGTYRQTIAEKERLFGKYVMDELKAIGIAGRYPETGGMEYRLSENGSKYPNGQPRDYYYIVANCVEANLPGVIIEHAFISNRSDVMNFMSTSDKLQKLGIADAKAILNYVKYMRTNEEQERDGWYLYRGNYYYYKDGRKLKSQFLNLTDGIYYLDENGKRCSGWKDISGKRYYFQENGKAATRWMKYEDNWYYFNGKYAYMYRNAKLTSGQGNIYIFDAEGRRAKGWCIHNKHKYYVGSNGRAYKGLNKIEDKYYFFHTSRGYLFEKTLIRLKNKDVYYTDENGCCYTNKFVTLKLNGVDRKYYFGADGRALKRWQRISGKWYYFHKTTGIAYRNRTSTTSTGKVYYFDSDGVCTNR